MAAWAFAAGAADAPPKIRLEPVARGLERPVQVTHDGSGRVFIVEQAGRIRLVKEGEIQRKAYLDLAAKLNVQGECGLLGLAFHPDFARNGYLYVNYTPPIGEKHVETVIAEFKADPKAETIDPASERIILRIAQPYPNHNGGHIEFGPDGYLYIGMGDGGAGADPHGHAQNPASLHGKMLRIDVNQRNPYGIPRDNPFVNDRAYRPEIYALGLRNPWRFSFDRKTGLLYAADVGQERLEEVNIITRGGNYGWHVREGSLLYWPQPTDARFIDPIHEYGHEKNDRSITGGCVYRGESIPALRGWYVYGDYASGNIWALRYDPKQKKVTGHTTLVDVHAMLAAAAATQPATTQPRRRPRYIQPSGFGEDAAGELYVCDHNGAVYRIVGE